MVYNARALEKRELSFGKYGVATAQASYGDVLRIVNGTDARKKGVFIADTHEHDTKFAKPLIKFLDDAIQNGWGLDGNSEAEILRLVGRLNNIPVREDSIECVSYGSLFLFLQLGDAGVSIVNGGLPGPLMVNKDGSVEKIDIFGFPLYAFDHRFSFAAHHAHPYESRLADGDILFLRTDGVDEGLTKSLGTAAEGKMRLEDALRNCRNQSAIGIRDSLLLELGEYFLPKSEEDDDVTLSVIKFIG